MKRSRSIHDDIAVKKSKSDENESPNLDNTDEASLKGSVQVSEADNVKVHPESTQDNRPIAKPTKRLNTKASEESKEKEEKEKEEKEHPNHKSEDKPKDILESKAEDKSEAKAEDEREANAENKSESKLEDKSEDEKELGAKESNTTSTKDSTVPDNESQVEANAGKETTKSESKSSEPKTNTGFAGFSSFSKFSSGGGFGSAFGGGLKSGFGSGFGSFASAGSIANKDGKANPWAEKSTNPWAEKPGKNAWAEDSDAQKKGDDAEYTEDDKQNAKQDAKQDAFVQVTLEKQDVRTGEEDESTIESVRARLYAVDSEAKAWKERGTGVLKLNTTTQDGEKKFRLVMRLDGVLRVSLNVPLFKNMQLLEGFANSLHTERFFRFSGIEDGEARQFAVRCPSEEARDQFFEAIKSALEELE